MDVFDARVRKYQIVRTLRDKKLKEHKSLSDKYIVPLSNNHPFNTDEFVKVLRKSDFKQNKNYLK